MGRRIDLMSITDAVLHARTFRPATPLFQKLQRNCGGRDSLTYKQHSVRDTMEGRKLSQASQLAPTCTTDCTRGVVELSSGVLYTEE